MGEGEETGFLQRYAIATQQQKPGFCCWVGAVNVQNDNRETLYNLKFSSLLNTVNPLAIA
ncbi:hypothetical protein BI308_24885 [Roseofilum reptotaenium AO1-A]|uniref:Uncharacterized protein n=2 Tax=Roseofilum TaxID=1233426 RepID=A0A1L9QJP2_9CYAN|nr:hypothetical protein BI308_24885 [Roseofilum reptotaenium AO1-A]